ncbi:uncharacterized protein akna [Hippocampus comes]|uniref:uncharacterized protein akna n=1 Tax=Hippocampus comes TaxID=109280 RepID=UPI00094EC22E|nr:PREDICTED: AT-hook-containing transcription factor [Hippocampus comes]
METVKNTKTGVLSWTPAPTCVSPATSETSEDAWDEEEEQDDDFYGQMDENGIIGLTLVDDPREHDDNAECNGTSSPGHAIPEGLAVCVVPDMPPDELCSTLDERLEDEDVLSPFCDDVCVLKERGHNQAKANERETPKGQKTEYFSQRDSHSDTAQGERDGTEDTHSLMSCVSSLHHQESSEEEEDQEDVLSPQPQSSENSQTGLKKPSPSPGPRSQPCHEAALPRTSSHNKPKEDCRHTPRRADESRKGYPSHWVPDLSKVKPRVSFPKGDYKPPKSRWSSKNPPKSLTPEAPVVFKSPADIVKEVLLNTTDGPQPPLDLNKRTSAGTVPQEFRSHQKADILLDQLQEDHGRLLTKYAEAANTIDRLRLEAKVNLYSEQQMPAHVVPLGQHAEPSKFMRLDFPQAQKAQPSAVSPQPSGPSTHIRASSTLCLSSSISKSLESQGNRKVANALFAQADKFLQQLQHFEEFLKSKMPFQQVKGLTQLYQGLDSLEKGYLAARKEHKVQQQQGAEHSHFDPDRELEEFIYQCGQHMDELKERVDRNSRAADSARSLSPEAQKSPACDDSRAESQHTPLSLDSVKLTNKEVGPGNLNSSHKKKCDEQATDVDQSPTVHLTPTPASRRRKEVRKSCSSSQCSLAEISALEKRSADLQTSPTVHLTPTPASRRRKEVRKSCSSSQCSLAEISALEKRSADLQTGMRRVLSQPILCLKTYKVISMKKPSPVPPQAPPAPLSVVTMATLLKRRGPVSDSSQASQSIKSTTPAHIGESRMAKPLSGTNSTQGNCTQHRTSHALRCRDHSSDVGGSSRKKWSIDDNEVEKRLKRLQDLQLHTIGVSQQSGTTCCLPVIVSYTVAVDSSKEEERSRPSPCVVPECSVDEALLAAQKIKDVSKNMVRSLTAGMRSLERLSKSRSNSNSD